VHLDPGRHESHMTEPSRKHSILLLFAAAIPVVGLSVACAVNVDLAFLDERLRLLFSSLIFVLFSFPVAVAALRFGFRIGLATSVVLGLSLVLLFFGRPDFQRDLRDIVLMSTMGIGASLLLSRTRQARQVLQHRADAFRQQSVELSSQLEEKRQAEEALRQSEAQYRLLADNMADCIWLSDLDLRYTYQSPSVTRLRGYTAEEALAQTVEETLTPASFELAMKALEEEDLAERSGHRDPGRSRTLELEVRCKDGSTLWTEHTISAVRDQSGRPVALLGVARDITYRHRAETELRVQKALIDRILTTLPNAVLVVDRDMRVVLANKTFDHSFHTHRSRVVGQQLDAIRATRSLVSPVTDVLADGMARDNIEFRQRVGSTERTFAADVIPMYRREVLVIIRDVTEEREKLDKLYLTDRLASVGEMAAGIAHEINNPLTGVVALSQLLMEGALPDEIREDIRDIYLEGQRAADTVRNLLTFARGQGAEKRPTQINDVLEEVLRLRSYEEKVRNISVTKSLGPNLPAVMADRSQIQQAFLNIVLNAEQAMIEANGRGTLTVASRRVDGHIKVTFADNGPGIERHILKRVFDPFFTTKELGKGTGLGLSVSYGIVAAHGGQIRVRTIPGRGTTFAVELPASNA